MKKKLVILGLLSVLAIASGLYLALFPIVTPAKTANSKENVKVEPTPQIEEKVDCSVSDEGVIQAINEERVMVGVKPLVLSQSLDKLADDRATEQNGTLDAHAGLQKYKVPSDPLYSRYQIFAEDQNALGGCSDSRVRVGFFKESSKHWTSLMNARYDEVGVGFYKDVLNINLGDLR